jgi:BMFP domain-containing protein YqiC
MNAYDALRDFALFSEKFSELIIELEREMDAYVALAGRLEARVIELEQKASQGTTITDLYCRDQLDKLEDQIKDLEQKGSQSVSIKIDGDIGERLDELEQRLNDELHSQDDIREWAREEAQEVLSNASFDITVN